MSNNFMRFMSTITANHSQTTTMNTKSNKKADKHIIKIQKSQNCFHCLPYCCGMCVFNNPSDHAFLMISCGYYTVYICETLGVIKTEVLLNETFI